MRSPSVSRFSSRPTTRTTGLWVAASTVTSLPCACQKHGNCSARPTERRVSNKCVLASGTTAGPRSGRARILPSAACSSEMCVSSRQMPSRTRLPASPEASSRAKAMNSPTPPSGPTSSTSCSYYWASSSNSTSANLGTEAARCSVIRAWRPTASASGHSRPWSSTPTTTAARSQGRRSGRSGSRAYPSRRRWWRAPPRQWAAAPVRCPHAVRPRIPRGRSRLPATGQPPAAGRLRQR